MKFSASVQPSKQPPESLGNRWWYSLRLEWLGNNLAVAGALEYAYRLGHANREIRDLRLLRAC
jgi:hypothetical protein